MATLIHDFARHEAPFVLAVAATLACRLVNLWLPLAIGAVAFAALRLGARRRDNIATEGNKSGKTATVAV